MNNARAERRPTYANAASTAALILALAGLVGGGAAYAAESAKPGKAKVGAAQIKKNAVKRSKIAPNAVNGRRVADGSLTGLDVADGSVTGGKLADGSVTGGKLADGSVTGGKLANGSVTGASIAEDALGARQINERDLQRVPRADHAALASIANALDPDRFAVAVVTGGTLDAAKTYGFVKEVDDVGSGDYDVYFDTDPRGCAMFAAVTPSAGVPLNGSVDGGTASVAPVLLAPDLRVRVTTTSVTGQPEDKDFTLTVFCKPIS